MKLTTRLHSVSPSDFVNRMSFKWTGALQALPELQPGTYEILHALLNQAASDILELYFQRLQFVKWEAGRFWNKSLKHPRLLDISCNPPWTAVLLINSWSTNALRSWSVPLNICPGPYADHSDAPWNNRSQTHMSTISKQWYPKSFIHLSFKSWPTQSEHSWQDRFGTRRHETSMIWQIRLPRCWH